MGDGVTGWAPKASSPSLFDEFRPDFINRLHLKYVPSIRDYMSTSSTEAEKPPHELLRPKGSTPPFEKPPTKASAAARIDNLEETNTTLKNKFEETQKRLDDLEHEFKDLLAKIRLL